MPSRIFKLTPYTCPTDSITHALLKSSHTTKNVLTPGVSLRSGEGGQTYGQAEAGTEIFSPSFSPK